MDRQTLSSSSPTASPAASPASSPQLPQPAVAGGLLHDLFRGLTHYGGFDWAREQHQVVVVDPAGKIVLNLHFDETAQGWALLREKVAAFPKLGVAIETSCGPAVERLLELGLSVYPLNPKSAQRYRDRKAPSGAKDDFGDAWSMGDGLRTDGHAWKPLAVTDPLTMELRLLCRDEIGLIEQRTALVNQLRAALHEYYPAALEAFDDWTVAGPWNFVITFPTPASVVSAGKRNQEKFLHANKLYHPQTQSKRLEIFARASAFASPNPAVTRAKSLLAVTLARQLKALQLQLNEYRQRIGKLFDQHPDSGCFGSLPAGGEKLAPRLLGEIGADRQRFESFESLQSYAGTAPVTHKSGNFRRVLCRWACNKTLRATVHLWADLTRQRCAWADAYYQCKREQGKSHAAALRCLGQRWLKILWTMWQQHKPYDEARHSKNQVRHGSWVIALLPKEVDAKGA